MFAKKMLQLVKAHSGLTLMEISRELGLKDDSIYKWKHTVPDEHKRRLSKLTGGVVTVEQMVPPEEAA